MRRCKIGLRGRAQVPPGVQVADGGASMHQDDVGRLQPYQRRHQELLERHLHGDSAGTCSYPLQTSICAASEMHCMSVSWLQLPRLYDCPIEDLYLANITSWPILKIVS